MTNTKKPLTLICVQPCIPYYAWQIEVMLTNFTQLELHKHYDIHILCAYNEREPNYKENISYVKKVEDAFLGAASFFYFQDTREYPISYISSIRPNLLRQHYAENGDKIAKTAFYHDCDIIFTKFPDFIEKYLDDEYWYLSDTRHYIGYDYILSKGQDVLEKMISIVGISQVLVKYNQENSGGAQYIMKGVDSDFFYKMEKDCERLYKEITALNNEKKQQDPTHHELQIWCADMWAILWGAWIKGYETKIIPEMDFCWATDFAEKWQQKYIFHNAGVTSQISETHFYKADFRNKYPYLHDGSGYDQTKASYKYFEIIKSIGEKSVLL